MIVAIAVGLGGAVGSVSRYLIDGAVQDRSRGAFPFGTFSVNALGSFILGVLTGLFWYHGLAGSLDAVLGTGLCGGLTTWSTASWETVRLAEIGMPGKALVNAAGGIGVAVLAAGIGILIASI